MDIETNETSAVLGTCLPMLRTVKIAEDLVNDTNGYGIMIIQAIINDFSDMWFDTAIDFMVQDDPYYTASVINKHLSDKISDPLFQTRIYLSHSWKFINS